MTSPTAQPQMDRTPAWLSRVTRAGDRAIGRPTAKRTRRKPMPQVSNKVIGRLGLYRRLLSDLAREGTEFVFSHELAKRATVTSAQVRRDIMSIGYVGNPAKGYDVGALSASISQLLDAPEGQNVVLMGIGNLGRALLAYFSDRRMAIQIIGAFDSDEQKVNRVLHGFRCYHVRMLNKIVAERNVDVGIIAVPAEQAQEVAERMVEAGIRGILNFAPTRLALPHGVYVEDINMSVSLERVAFMARAQSTRTELRS
jgi:redox-sensing transcriptional repressor